MRQIIKYLSLHINTTLQANKNNIIPCIFYFIISFSYDKKYSGVGSLTCCLSLAELLLETVIPVEPSEEDEERNEARTAEATGRRSSGLPFARVSPLRTGGDLDGPRGGDAAASQSPRQATLLPGHAEHRRAQVFQLQNRSRTGPVVAQVGIYIYIAFLFIASTRLFRSAIRFLLCARNETRRRLSRVFARGTECPRFAASQSQSR